MQRLAQIDYAMSRINLQFKMDVLNKYGLSESGYQALINTSQDSQSLHRSCERNDSQDNQIQGPLLNIMLSGGEQLNIGSNGTDRMRQRDQAAVSTLEENNNSLDSIHRARWSILDTGATMRANHGHSSMPPNIG